MESRIDYQQLHSIQPALTTALLNLGETVATQLEASLIHLVKLRASQINGCAFCQHMHANEARNNGEQQQRLDILPAWQDVPAFSDRERAALRWTEQLTDLSNTQTVNSAYEALQQHFSQAEIVNLTGLIVVINGWNRIAIGFGFIPELTEK